ncbi:hypothetical protein, partial [Paremcibacter congregatus]|uniref:hypothetical protein n=1 Tax=Paremcibacter congregatus TaxID=2043170 RepID=UPI003A907BA5
MTETPHDENAVPDFSGEAHQTLDISPPHPKPRVINRKIIWGASLISGLLAIGVVYSSISKQRSIAENSKADEAAPNISQTAIGPGSAVNLPGSYTEFRAYQKRKDAEEAARQNAAATSPAPHLPKSL